MFFAQAMNRLDAVMENFGMPGTCEATLRILKGMSASEQQHAAVRYPTEMKGLALQYPRFKAEAPSAVAAAEEALELGL